MESGFAKADSRNLPVVNITMVNNFFVHNAQFISSEIKNVKTERAGRDAYGDDAVGFIQVRRENALCTIKAKITPEHRVHAASYVVIAVINEEDETVISCTCQSCAASEGGCKHSVAFLLWLHRRSEEPSVTEVECYWRKSKLSSVGQGKACTLSEMFSSGVLPLKIKGNSLREKYIKEAKKHNSESLISTMYDNENKFKKISLHCLALKYCKVVSEENGDPNDFINFCISNISSEDCEYIEKNTVTQNKNTKWYDARFGRITASKLFEVSRCQTFHGTLVENIFGANKFPQTEAMRRGQLLEDAVLKAVEEDRKLKIMKCGLFIYPQNPVFGASPDGLTAEYVVEIKCPSTEKTLTNYINPDGELQNKSKAQIQLQMFLTGKKKGLFCGADPNFENNKKIFIKEVTLNKIYCESIKNDALNFWKQAIYPKLMKE